MRPLRTLLVRALVLVLASIGASCASDDPTSSDPRAADTPSLDGTGWTGGGGRIPGDSTTKTGTHPDSLAGR